MKSWILIISLLLPLFCAAQNRGNIWCFGDSSGIDFSNINNPTPIISALRTRGSCASISDSVGNLLFYSGYDPTVLIGGADPFKVYDVNNSIMLNGDSLKGGSAWYNQSMIIPHPSSNYLFFVFHIGVTHDYGLYHSVIDLSANNGLGAITQKNIQLQSFANVDCLNAIKHGNGRDWWFFFRRWQPGVPVLPTINEFHSYLVTPNGITNYTIQQVGSGSYTGLGKLTFSALGDRLVLTTYAGLIEIYDFDRCTGVISNPVNIFQETTGGIFNNFWGCEFSPNCQVLYVTLSDQTSYLFQFDLNAPNVASSIDTLWTISNPGEAIGGLKRGPDGKIYESGPDTSPLAFSYPYSDSLYTMYNMNLGVINSPDSLGLACDFQPYSFYLGGKRTYWGLPNNPDYDMPALAGSPCDTLVGIIEIPVINSAAIHAFYHSSWEKVFITASGLKGNAGMLMVYDIQGKVIFKEPLRIHTGYYTKDLSMIGKAKGTYVVVVITDQEQLVKKFVIE